VREPIYCVQVEHPFKGWINVGRAYTDKSAAQSWRPFVKSAWNGLPTRVKHVASNIAVAPAEAQGVSRG
jgi:hypothetical protein